MPALLLLSGAPTSASGSVSRGCFRFSCSSLFHQFLIGLWGKGNAWMGKPLLRDEDAGSLRAGFRFLPRRMLLRDGDGVCRLVVVLLANIATFFRMSKSSVAFQRECHTMGC